MTEIFTAQLIKSTQCIFLLLSCCWKTIQMKLCYRVMHFKYWSLYLTAWRFSTGLTRVLLKLFGILQEPDGIPLPKLKQPINYIDKAAQIVTRVSSSRQTWYKNTQKDFFLFFGLTFLIIVYMVMKFYSVWCSKFFKQLQLKKDAIKTPKTLLHELARKKEILKPWSISRRLSSMPEQNVCTDSSWIEDIS